MPVPTPATLPPLNLSAGNAGPSNATSAPQIFANWAPGTEWNPFGGQVSGLDLNTRVAGFPIWSVALAAGALWWWMR